MAQQEHTVRVGGRRIRLTHLERVLYPETGTTKAEIVDYYVRVAPVMLPHLAGRPVTRRRWPDGVERPGFYAKGLDRSAPEWIARRAIEHSTGTKQYVLAEDAATLVWLAQTASLELHTPQWRFLPDGGRAAPDRLVLDLDPGEGVGLPECAEVARLARALLDDIGLAPMPVTSGSKGIHLYSALPRGQTSEQASALARELARALEADHRDLVVSSMSKTHRPGRVLVDWSQNNGKKTTIAPYSLRGGGRPTVAAPRTWAELDDLALAQLDLDNALRRVGDLGDPLAQLGASGASEAPLQRYLAKRSAGRTPEPMPEHPDATTAGEDGAARFVVHEHHARRLHYDLRLERGGVLVSWAVPKGIPESPERDHLAVMTEDHPLAYGSFEGNIPKGEYGAGRISIWDDGTYELEKWRDDEVIVTLSGRRGGPIGRARFALVRTDGAGERSTWLLHRTKTAGARSAARRTTEAETRTATSAASTVHPRTTRPMLAQSASPGQARAAARGWASPWAEIKWDGVRALGFWDGTRLRLRARSGTDLTARYPELTARDMSLGADTVVVDGEIVALDIDGRPSFSLLQSRMHLTEAAEIRAQARRVPVRMMLFDLLARGGDDLTRRPLRDRRRALESVVDGASSILAAPPMFDDVDDARTASVTFALEGIVVKDPLSPYRAGERSGEWLKVKNTRTQEVVIGGVRPGRGDRAGRIGSLLMGVPTPEGLRYLGRVGTGFDDRTLRQLDELLAPLGQMLTPFADVPGADAADARWVRPELVGEVEYADATPDGRLRHARWRGLRSDKSPVEVRWEG